MAVEPTATAPELPDAVDPELEGADELAEANVPGEATAEAGAAVSTASDEPAMTKTITTATNPRRRSLPTMHGRTELYYKNPRSPVPFEPA